MDDTVCGPSTSRSLMSTPSNDDRIESSKQKLESLIDDVSQVKDAIGDINDLKSQF